MQSWMQIGKRSLAALALMGAVVMLHAQSEEQVSPELEQALLQENWMQVASLLDSVDTQTPSPVLRMLKGHACLALNRNNESLCLFAHAFSQDSVIRDKDFKAWNDWAQVFCRHNSGNPVSFFLRGDSEARLKKFSDAVASFTTGLSMGTEKFYLLNARATAFAAIADWDAAVIDLDSALEIQKQIADLYCSRGAIDIFLRTPSGVAEKMFNRALEISPDCPLAANGLGCINYGAGNYEKSQKYFETTLKMNSCLMLVLYNTQTLAAEWIATLEKQENLLATANPGTNINRTIKSLEFQKNMTRAAEIAKDAGYNTMADLGSALFAKASIRIPIAERMNGKTSKAGAEIGFSTGIDGSKAIERNRPFMDAYFQASKGAASDRILKIQDRIAVLEKTRARIPSLGGVTTDMKKAQVDDGDWPVDTVFGLFYVVEPINFNN